MYNLYYIIERNNDITSDVQYIIDTKGLKEKEAIDTFKSVRVIEADVEGEFAFVTDVMSEKEFNEKADAVGIISRIRMEA